MVSQSPNPFKTYELRHIHPNDMCRICMLPSDYLKNSGHELTLRICKMLHICTQINVSINDGYPQVVCNNCYKQLNESYKFVLLAKNTSRKLRKTEQTEIKSMQEILEHQKTLPVIDLESKTNLLLMKENIDTNSNINVINTDPKKINIPSKSTIKSNVNNKENAAFKKRFILRSDIKKEDDVIIIDNNNSIDLTETSPIVENLEPKPIQTKLSTKVLTPQPISEKTRKRSSNETKRNVKNPVITNNVDKIDNGTNLQNATTQKVSIPPLFNDKSKKQMDEESKKNLNYPILVENGIAIVDNDTTLISLKQPDKTRKRSSNENKKSTKCPISVENDVNKTSLVTTQPEKTKKRSSSESNKNLKYPVLIEKGVIARDLQNKPQKVLLSRQLIKKRKKRIIKINTKYLTRTVKKEIEGKPCPNKKEKKIVEIKTESTSPTLDDILSAVGLVRKVSSEVTVKYECEKCDQKFSFIEPYKRHLAIKHKLSPYECRLCGEKLSSRNKLRKHKDDVHGGKNPYRCLDCDATFKVFENFLIHMRKTHIKKLPYPCKICKSNFMTKQKLQEHSQKHTNKKEIHTKQKKNNHQCEYCEKKFLKNSDLIRHLRVHTGEKPFVCNVCNTGFQQAHNLTKHMVIHTHEKAFVCDICKKHFGRNDSMLRHMLTHSIEKPFVCTKCKKGFARQSQLNQHYKKNHATDKNMVSSLRKEI